MRTAEAGVSARELNETRSDDRAEEKGEKKRKRRRKSETKKGISVDQYADESTDARGMWKIRFFGGALRSW